MIVRPLHDLVDADRHTCALTDMQLMCFFDPPLIGSDTRDDEVGYPLRQGRASQASASRSDERSQ